MKTTQMKVYFPTNEEKDFTKPDVFFFTTINFSYEHLLKELPQEAILLFHSLIEQFNDRDLSFFEILNDRKKWETTVKKFGHIKMKPAQFNKHFEDVCTFFSQQSSKQFVYDIAEYFRVATYEVEGEKSWLLFDDYDGETIPFTLERIDSKGGIQFHDAHGETTIISPQVLMFIRLAETEEMKRLTSFKVKAEVDEAFPEHVQLLLATCKDDTKSSLFFKVLTSPLTNSLQAVMTYYKLFRYLEDTYATEESEDIRQAISVYYAQLSQHMYRIVSTNFMLYISNKSEKEEKSAATNKAKLEETLEKLDKQKELNKELKKQQTELKKQQKEFKEQPMQVVERNDPRELEKLKEELKNLHLKYKRLEQEKSRDEDRLQKEVTQLKQDNSTLQKKLHPLLKIQEQPKIETIAQWLELGRELIQNINDVEEREIREFFELFLIVCDEQNARRPKQELASNLFGYVSVSKEGHHIHLGDGREELIHGIPAHIYLAEGQFVQVTSDFEYVQDYTDFLDVPLEGQVVNFSVIKLKDELPHVYHNGTLKRITHELTFIQLREGQIVSFNHQLELIRFYKQQRLQLDLFEQSIKYKKHVPYYVQKVLPTGAVVTNVFTNEESFITFSNADNLEDGKFITTIDNSIVRTFHGNFFKLSSFYNRSELVSICEMVEVCFGKKLNREIVIIKNIPPHMVISVGDTVRIDEWHNYLELVKSETTEDETLEKRLSRRASSTVKEVDTTEALLEIKSAGLIVGNPSYFESYGQLKQYGYEVEGIDGYESFTRLKQAAKDKDFIVVCTGYVSHDNMFAIKDTYPANQVIYSERDGATQIALQLKSSNF